MNIISFSVWGNDPFYVKGIKENIELAEEYYPGWKCKIYYDNTFDIGQVPEDVRSKGIFEYVERSRGKWDGLFWRFYPATDPDVDVMIVRDLDSRVNSREAAAVKEWLASPYDFHAMRDHIDHNVPIMGGMWGCRNKILKDMKDHIQQWRNFDNKGTDQEFLREVIWRKVREKAIVHDKYFNDAFVLPDKKIVHWEDIEYYNADDFCGDSKQEDFPRGKITLKDGRNFQRLDVYEYRPLHMFGFHVAIPFPSHEPMKHGTCVGDYVR
jgi:hypothetical protein